jgi:hypothetical protein
VVDLLVVKTLGVYLDLVDLSDLPFEIRIFGISLTVYGPFRASRELGNS